MHPAGGAKGDDKVNMEIRQQHCFDWLRKNGAGDLIKNNVEVQFGRDEDILSLHTTLFQGRADLGFVLVCAGGIDVGIARFKRCEYGGFALAGLRHQEDAEAEGGNLGMMTGRAIVGDMTQFHID